MTVFETDFLSTVIDTYMHTHTYAHAHTHAHTQRHMFLVSTDSLTSPHSALKHAVPNQRAIATQVPMLPFPSQEAKQL